MALPTSLVLASEVIGFISFTFTLLTALGVYADLIKTLRSAPSTIPLALGNLREEIIYERQLCAQRLSANDEFHTFPGRKPKRRSHREFLQLMSETVRQQWLKFCDIERDFLVTDRKPIPAGSQRTGNEDDDNNDTEHSADEKPRGRRRRSDRPKQNRPQSFLKSRMGWIEAGLSRDQHTYYNTDLAHRFAWWWKKDDLKDLAQQVQRIQIRRIERDSYEANSLVKRGLRIYGRQYGYDVYDSNDSDSDSNDGGSSRKRPRRGGGPDGSGDGRNGGGVRAVDDTRKTTIDHNQYRPTHRRRLHVDTTTSPKPHSRTKTASRPTRARSLSLSSSEEVIRRRPPSRSRGTPPSPTRRQTRSPAATPNADRSYSSNVGRRRPSAAAALSRDSNGSYGPVVYEYEIIDPGGAQVEYIYDQPPPPHSQQSRTK